MGRLTSGCSRREESSSEQLRESIHRSQGLDKWLFAPNSCFASQFSSRCSVEITDSDSRTWNESIHRPTICDLLPRRFNPDATAVLTWTHTITQEIRAEPRSIPSGWDKSLMQETR